MRRKLSGLCFRVDDRQAPTGARPQAVGNGRCEGRKPVPAAVVAKARCLARRNPKTGKTRSLRAIAAELAAAGYVGLSGKPYFAGSIQHMLGA